MIKERADYADEVNFFGGEPLLNFEAIKNFIEAMEKIGVEVKKYSMITNLMLLTADMIPFLEKYNFQITISMDGPENVHDVLRPNCKHTVLMEKIKILLNSKIRDNISINCTYTKIQEKEYTRAELLEYFSGIGVKQITINNVITDSETLKLAEKTINHQQEIYNDIQNTCKGIKVGTHNEYLTGVIEALANGIYYTHYCEEMANGIAFDCEGTPYPCSKLIGMVEWDSAELKKNNKELDACKRCWARGICQFCIADYLIEKKNLIYNKICERKKLYAFALRELIKIYCISESDFQNLLNNFFE